MKKLIAMLLAMVMVLGLVACAAKTEPPAADTKTETPAAQTPAAETPAEETPAEETPAAEGAGHAGLQSGDDEQFPVWKCSLRLLRNHRRRRGRGAGP